MLQAASEASDFFRNANLEDFLANRGLQLIVERELEIVGEAARRISDTFRVAHPEIPWRAIISQRNVLAHEYGDIDPEIVWKVMAEDVPRLISALEPLLPSA
jgi:uncharacterized protein with HEPN domain